MKALLLVASYFGKDAEAKQGIVPPLLDLPAIHLVKEHCSEVALSAQVRYF